jgi:hypothetical protein
MVYQGDISFILRDPRQEYTPNQVVVIVERAEAAGVVLAMGGCIDCLTVNQLIALTNDPRKCDA